MRHKRNVIEREPSGRVSRSVVKALDGVPPTEAKRLRDAAVRGMQAPEWGTEIGRLFLEGKISSPLFEAGKRWGRLVVAYHKAIGAPSPYPRSMDLGRVRGKSTNYDPDTREIITAMTEAHAVLSSYGYDIERAVRNVCEENEATVGARSAEYLIRGLKALALFWGLTTEPKRGKSASSPQAPAA
jgi:hypothetical protein